ncbi:hypothetical protein [Flavobacterium chungnamense]|jgi:hypothetical protein|uniref:Uncharacterized protein n=1 Tax=Flavobacterium chungnamense TaxID=706182 RepID=A0ABP7UPY4_9FLAO
MTARRFNLLKFNLYSLIFLVTYTSQSQNDTPTSLHDWYDSKVGKENLDINNGKILLNYDIILKNNDRFYFQNYTLGSVVYDNQLYNNVLLNYDINNDDLIIKPNGENDKMPIVLNKSKVNSFYVNGKNYINLGYNKISNNEVVPGFYEEVFLNNNMNFYIRHIKDKRQIINENLVFDDFTEITSYIILYKNQYYKITNKKSLTTIFPELKKNINEFYSNNSSFEKSNKAKFLEDLFKYLNTIIK